MKTPLNYFKIFMNASLVSKLNFHAPNAIILPDLLRMLLGRRLITQIYTTSSLEIERMGLVPVRSHNILEILVFSRNTVETSTQNYLQHSTFKLPRSVNLGLRACVFTTHELFESQAEGKWGSRSDYEWNLTELTLKEPTSEAIFGTWLMNYKHEEFSSQENGKQITSWPSSPQFQTFFLRSSQEM